MHGAEVKPSPGQIAMITDVAGTYGDSGSYDGSGGNDNMGLGGADNALLRDPSNVAVDTLGNIFIADSGNNVIREVSATTGDITTVAGNGMRGYSGDGELATATTAELNCPMGIAMNIQGNLFIADSGNDVIREVSAATQDITTVAGYCSWASEGSGDTAARGAATARG